MPQDRRFRVMAAVACGALAVGACSSGGGTVSPSSAAGAGGDLVPTTYSVPPTTIRVSTTVPTTVAPTTTTPETTPPTTIAPTTSVIGIATTAAPAETSTTIVAAPAPCPGPTSLPTDASGASTATGDIDGDGVDDHVISYTGADGAAHVFLQRGSGSGSDAIVSLDGAAHVDISLEDFDHSLGAVTPPPLAVFAVTDKGDGSALATFLSIDGTPSSCLQQWRLDGQPFTFPIDSRGPYAGLFCDHAAGQTYYVLRTASTGDEPPASSGAPTTTSTVAGGAVPPTAPQLLVTTTGREIHHTGIEVNVIDLGTESIADDGTLAANYGDIVGCDHDPLFSPPPADTTTTTNG